jgi:hypothetical protein
MAIRKMALHRYRAAGCLLLGMVLIAGTLSLAATRNFFVPQDTALRIRLGDTLTSVDSQVGDPFTATVVDAGEYRNAQIHGHVAEVDMSGKVEGHTSMALRFDRLVMPDGRHAPIHAEIVELYHAPSGEKVDVEGAVESGGRGRKVSSIQRSARELAPSWAESSAEARARGLGPSSAEPGDWGLPHFVDTKRSLLAAGRKC